MKRPNDFSRQTQLDALKRQGNHCASCGVAIARLGEAGRAKHFYGEGARAHHMIHIKLGGQGTLRNCVILCESCHYAAHEGGNYSRGLVVGNSSDYPHFEASQACSKRT